MRYPGARVSALIAAPVEAVWEVVSDVTRHPELAGSGEVQFVEVLDERGLAEGRLFRSRQRMRGLDYVTVSRVVRWDPPYGFAWRVGTAFAPGVAQTWMFSLTPAVGGTRVENSVLLIYALPAVWPFTLLHTTIGRLEAQVMQPTLVNLAHILGVPEPDEFNIEYAPPPAAVQLMPPAGLQLIFWLAAAGLAGLVLRRRR